MKGAYGIADRPNPFHYIPKAACPKRALQFLGSDGVCLGLDLQRYVEPVYILNYLMFYFALTKSEYYAAIVEGKTSSQSQ